jgi:shikimate kinase/3-dehydroquinate synthase
MKSVVLSGFMATGKTTVGELVAKELGLPFVDTDALIAAATGKTVGEVFASEGEAKFRDREVDLILPLLDDGVPRVLSFGGGAVTVPRIRYAALETATVVTLTAAPETISERVTSHGVARPALGARSQLDRVKAMLALRHDVYGECHGTIVTDGKTPEQIARAVVAIAAKDAIAVPLGDRSYAVELGNGTPLMLTAALAALEPSSIIVVSDENVIAARGAWLETALQGIAHTRIVLTPGEENKTLDSVSKIWNESLAAGIDRNAVILAFGGGVVGDLAGFAASTLLRGVRCVQIATSLLAMVDTSVGGKTGFDHPVGKNLLGSFFQPSRVLLDLEHLVTLPDRHRAAGLAEVVKIALVHDAPLLSLLESRGALIALGDRTVLRDVVRAAVTAKMRVVREDEHETGVRALLNLGHTVGHALETHGHYKRWIHGEAIAIGTVLELAATERMGKTPPGTAEHAAALLTRFGLPTTATKSDLTAAWPYVMADKKRTKSAVKLPIVTGRGIAHVERIELDALKDALGIAG